MTFLKTQKPSYILWLRTCYFYLTLSHTTTYFLIHIIILCRQTKEGLLQWISIWLCLTFKEHPEKFSATHLIMFSIQRLILSTHFMMLSTHILMLSFHLLILSIHVWVLSTIHLMLSINIVMLPKQFDAIAQSLDIVRPSLNVIHASPNVAHPFFLCYSRINGHSTSMLDHYLTCTWNYCWSTSNLCSVRGTCGCGCVKVLVLHLVWWRQLVFLVCSSITTLFARQSSTAFATRRSAHRLDYNSWNINSHHLNLVKGRRLASLSRSPSWKWM